MSDPEDMNQKVEQLKAELREQDASRERDMVESIRDAYRKAGLPLRSDYYILEGDEVRAVDGPTWSIWFENHFADRVIVCTVVQADIEVSTVFLGIDHGFGRTGQPILFETMVFGGLLDEEQVRYATLAEARAGHWTMVERVKRAEAGEAL